MKDGTLSSPKIYVKISVSMIRFGSFFFAHKMHILYIQMNVHLSNEQ